MIIKSLNNQFSHIFTPRQNLKKDNIVFTVKKLVSNFKRNFSLLFEDDFNYYGKLKEYEMDELLGICSLRSL